MESRRLSRLPLRLAMVSVGISVVLCLPVFWRMNTDEGITFAVLGYLLTPFVTAGLLVWSRRMDLRSSAEAGYARADARHTLRTLSMVVGLSFVPALVHIWYIAGFIGSALS